MVYLKDGTLVFVYGTLRKHEVNHGFLEGAKCVAEQSWTNGQIYDTGLGYPAMKNSDEDKVYGEMYLIDDQKLQTLDELEGYLGPNQKNHYNRIKQMVFTDIGSHEAYVYIIHPNYENQLQKLIQLGDWKISGFQELKSDFLYFAYGSCMDHERFKLANVDHFFQKEKGGGVLEGYQMRFTKRLDDGGRADIVEEGGKVEGIVYELPADALEYLYRREGVYINLYRPALIDVIIDGKLVKDVLTFIVVDKDEETAPPIHYATEIIRGGSGTLSENYMYSLKKELRERFKLII